MRMQGLRSITITLHRTIGLENGWIDVLLAIVEDTVIAESSAYPDRQCRGLHKGPLTDPRYVCSICII